MPVYIDSILIFVHINYYRICVKSVNDNISRKGVTLAKVGGLSATNNGKTFWTGKIKTSAPATSWEPIVIKDYGPGGPNMSYGGDEPKLINGGTLQEVVISSKSGVPIIDNTLQAFSHYFYGGGSSAAIGINTTSSLMRSQEFQQVHQGIVNGEITQSGRFNVDMTDRVFHVGRTSVNYSINSRTVTYNIYQNDGFWDPDFIDEYFIGNGGFAPDGPGPNLERFGGCPYHYLTTTRIFSF